MPDNSSYELDEPYNETEIVFTAASGHLQPSEQTTLPQQPESNAEAELTSQTESDDIAAQQQVELLKEKLETNSVKREATPLNAKLLRIKQLLVETRQLNKESEKYNTQSAVLLSALGSLKHELESSEEERDTAFSELIKIKKISEELNSQLGQQAASAEIENKRSADNNTHSEALIANLDELVEHAKVQQTDVNAKLDLFSEQATKAQQQANKVDAKYIEIRALVEESNAVLSQLNQANDSAQARTDELDGIIGDFKSAQTECETLRDSLRELKLEVFEERQAQQALNAQSKSQIQHSEKLNTQQTTLLDLTQSRHEELRQELESTIGTAKKYENRLQITEQKLKDALAHQQRSEQQYEAAQSKLESNEKILKSAAKALAETNGQNSKFNASVSKFQHATEQSQNLIIRTHATLESVINRNELLERENKLLAQRLNSASAQTNHKPSPQAESPAPNHSNPFSFDGPNPNHFANRGDNMAGSFRLMVFLAVLVPLCFIAYSFANSARASELTAATSAELPVEQFLPHH
jgi:hypothetical protein